MIVDKNIDNGKGFDWGRASADYARYRDIYPQEFYQKIVDMGICVKGQKVLDLATGTGVLPRNMYRYGASFTGADIAENQIIEARRLSEGLNIDYIVSSAEKVDFPDNTFDVITACQCFMYFDKAVVLPKIAHMLKPGGRFAILFFAWLPDESEIARQSEELVLKYNPSWTGFGSKRAPVGDPEWGNELFDTEQKVAFDINVTFTQESWNGRMKACRGVDASLSFDEINAFNKEHIELLTRIAPKKFEILHYATMLILKVKK